MKKFLFFSIAFLLTFIYIGCQDPLVPDPEPVESTFIVSVNPESTAYNGSVYVNILAENIVPESIRMNKDVIPGLNFSIENLTEDTILNFIAIGFDNKKYIESDTIKVAEKPVPTRTDTICSLTRPWQIDSIFSRGSNYMDNDLPEEMTESKLYFHTDGTYESIAIDGRSNGAGWWKWFGPDSIKMSSNQPWGYIMTDTTFTMINSGQINFYSRK